MADSGIVHVVTGVPVLLSQYESQAHHALSSGTSFPASPVEKQLFYRTDLHKLYYYNGSSWVDMAGGGAPAAHAPTHQDGGSDEISIAALSGESATLTTHKDAVTGVHSFDKSCRVYNNATETIPHATEQVLTFNSEHWDTDAIHDTVTNNSRLTCKTAGMYIIFGHFRFASNVTGGRNAEIILNGVTYLAIARLVPVVAGSVDFFVVTVHSLAVYDYVTLAAYQDSGGNLDVVVLGNASPEFGMARIA